LINDFSPSAAGRWTRVPGDLELSKRPFARLIASGTELLDSVLYILDFKISLSPVEIFSLSYAVEGGVPLTYFFLKISRTRLLEIPIYIYTVFKKRGVPLIEVFYIVNFKPLSRVVSLYYILGRRGVHLVYLFYIVRIS